LLDVQLVVKESCLMPQRKARKKDLVRSRLRRVLNRRRKRAAQQAIKAALAAAAAKDSQALEAAVRQAQSALDKAAQHGPLHKRAAARRKARLMRRIGQVMGTA
jgi:small subunit ribosomal protein S20